MKMFDPHIHMTSRTTDDYAGHGAAGIAAIVEPAFWLGQPRTHVGTFEDYFLVAARLGALPREPVRHPPLLHASRSTRRRPTTRTWPQGVIELLPRYLEKDGVVAVGEIGFDDMTAGRGALLRTRSSSSRASFELPVLVHTPHRDKKRGTERTHRAAARGAASPRARCSSITTTRRRCRSCSTTGCWAGHSIYPNTKMDEQRMVALVKKYGAERIIVNSAADWGVSDPLKVPKTVERDARGGHRRRATSRPIVWKNPLAFFGQSGRLDLEASSEPPGVDQRELFEGNSVLRGQAPVIERSTRSADASAPSSSTSSGSRPQLLRPSTRPHLHALAEQGGLRPLATITPAVTCSVQSTFTTGELPREHGIVGERLVLPRPRRGLVLAPVEPARRRARRSGTPPSGATRLHRAPSCSGGTTCTRAADFAVTPRPMYPADGRKLPDVYAEPAELRDELQRRARHVPAVQLLGAARRHRLEPRGSPTRARTCSTHKRPTLTLVYLPHLDYGLQRLGPDHPEIAQRSARGRRVCRRADRARRARRGARDRALRVRHHRGERRRARQPRAARSGAAARARRARPRVARRRRVATRSPSPTTRSRTSTSSDPQRIAEVKRAARAARRRRAACSTKRASARSGLDHPRSGELVAISARRPLVQLLLLARRRARARLRAHGRYPSQARLRPCRAVPRSRARASQASKIGGKLRAEALGFRVLLDVIPLDASLVQAPRPPHRRSGAGSALISSEPRLLPRVRSSPRTSRSSSYTTCLGGESSFFNLARGVANYLGMTQKHALLGLAAFALFLIGSPPAPKSTARATTSTTAPRSSRTWSCSGATAAMKASAWASGPRSP